VSQFTLNGFLAKLMFKAMAGLRAEMLKTEQKDKQQAQSGEATEERCDDEIDWQRVAGKKYKRSQGTLDRGTSLAVHLMSFCVTNEARGGI